MKNVLNCLYHVLPMVCGLLVASPAMSFALTANPDQEVLSLIEEVDLHEIQAAQTALQKQNIDPKVVDYAKMMEKEHHNNLDMSKKVGDKAGIQTVETPAVTNQRTKGADELARLNALEGAQFASAYIAAMVSGHNDALSVIDNNADKIQNQEVKQHVMETRKHIADHLEKAQQVQSELNRP